MRAIRKHITFANVVACLALFVALGGASYAAIKVPKNSVGTKQLKKGAVTPAKVKKNSLTGAQINEAKLGTVPAAASADIAADAAALGGRPPSAFLAANGKAVDSERLDGIDSSVFGNVQTIAGMNFEPRDSATKKEYVSVGAINCAGTPGDLTYRLELPEGARLTSIDFRYLDMNPVNSSLALVAFDSFGQGGFATETLATAVTSGETPGHRTATAAVNNLPASTVANGRYSYQLNWSPFLCAVSVELVGAAVHYTLPSG